jgi:predicted DNA-binding transcriptional regulator AlpA
MPKEQRVFLTTRQVRHRYGGVSHMWIERRLLDDPDFPKPVYFGRRRFWLLAALKTWERRRATNSTSSTNRRGITHTQ